MTDPTMTIDVLDARVKRREERRDFFKTITGSAAALSAGAAFIGGATQALAQTAPAPTDPDILNFALNLE